MKRCLEAGAVVDLLGCSRYFRLPAALCPARLPFRFARRSTFRLISGTALALPALVLEFVSVISNLPEFMVEFLSPARWLPRFLGSVGESGAAIWFNPSCRPALPVLRIQRFQRRGQG